MKPAVEPIQETTHEHEVSLNFGGKRASKFTYKIVETTYGDGTVVENHFLVGSRGAYYFLQPLDALGNEKMSGVYQPISAMSGPMVKHGNPVYLVILGGIVEVFQK